jgi:hypothetical protein
MFIRSFDNALINQLKREKLFNDKLLHDIKSGEVFPAIRNNFIDFYFNGSRLFQYDKNGFKTHIKFAAVIKDTQKPYLNEKELIKYKLIDNFYVNYKRIKENCANYSGKESIGVSDLYRRFSFIHCKKDIVVLDIELSFTSIEENSKSDRIDILLYSKEKNELKLVEAKHFTNKEIWSISIPKVVNQIGKYHFQVINKEKEILKAYNCYITALNNLFGLSLPYPEKVSPNIILFIFGFDEDQKKGRLNRLILKNKEYKGVYIYCKGNTKNMEILPLWNTNKKN